MAIFDPVLQRIAVRVVYDGVAFAGKTTNLKQLCTLFAAQRSNELHTPAELRGRTLFFDWMQIMAGAVCGFPLLCQIVSVPGQQVLAPRRRKLLETADVVVYVCDSRPSSLDAATAGLALLDDVVRARAEDVPLVIQANKQDQADAVDGAAVVRAIGRSGTHVVEAIASEGVGVVDTFMSAIRGVIRSITARSERGALRVPVRRTENATELLAYVGEAPIDPESAAELLLEEAEAALLLEQTMAEVENDPAARAVAAAAAEEILSPLRSDRPTPLPPRGVLAPPRAPSADVPTGFIWPAHTGRAVLRSLPFTIDAAGPNDDVVLELEGHVARTSSRARFADAELARQALVRRARECAQLDRLLVPDTVLVAQMADDGACWIWSVQPRLQPLERALARAPDLLGAYATALVEAIRAMLRFGFTLDLHPRSFGVRGDSVRYVGEIASEAPSAGGVSASVSAAIQAVARAGAQPHLLLESIEREMSRKLSSDERSALRFSEAS